MKKIILGVMLITGLHAGGDIPEYAPITIQDPVYAPAGFYAGAGIAWDQTYVAGSSDWFNTTKYAETTTGFMGLVGYEFYRTESIRLMAEGRISFAGGDYVDSTTYAVLFKPEYEFGGGFAVYGLAGYGDVELDHNQEEIPVGITASVSDFVWGVGAEYFIREDISLFADYTAMPTIGSVGTVTENLGKYIIETNDIRNDLISVGAAYRF